MKFLIILVLGAAQAAPAFTDQIPERQPILDKAVKTWIPQRSVSLEDLDKKITYLQTLIFEQAKAVYTEKKAIESFNKCTKACDKKFPWSDDPETKEWREARRSCWDSCPKIPDSVAGGC